MAAGGGKKKKGKSCQVNHKDRPTFRGMKPGGYVICHAGCARNPKPIFSAPLYCRKPAFSAFIARLEISHKSTINLGAERKWTLARFFFSSCFERLIRLVKRSESEFEAGFEYLLEERRKLYNTKQYK